MNKNELALTQHFLRETFDYYPLTGDFIRKSSGSHGCLDKHCGYIKVAINRKTFRAHRLIFFYCYGYWPKMVDHVNGVRNQNNLLNLQEADSSINSMKKRTIKKRYSPIEPDKEMLRFVTYHKQHKKYAVTFTIGKVRYNMGEFDKLEDANEKAMRLSKKRLEEYAEDGFDIKIPKGEI